MGRLRISDDVSLPADAVTQTIVVYGGKGMGKTNFGSVFAEELARNGHRFSLLDPIGVSWGLQYGADGRSPGIDILILGGVHGHLPIDPAAGSLVADFVVDESANVVIDISRKATGQMWGAGEKIRFVTDYCTRLFERQGERCRPLMQIMDEAGRFVPQNPPKGALEITKCIGAIEQLVEIGRNVGVGVCLITQRSARMNKSVSELAECMIAFRTVGPRSVDAILDWFGEHVEKDRWKELVGQLRSLPRGDALLVSPGWLNREGVVHIRARTTFDSSATPTGRTISPTGARKPDLEKYRVRLAEAVQRAEASDPRKVRDRVRELEAEVRSLQGRLERSRGPTTPAKPALDVKDLGELLRVRDSLASMPVDIDGALATARGLVDSLTAIRERVRIAGSGTTALYRKLQVPAVASPPAAPKPAPVPRAPAEKYEGSLSKGERAILAVLHNYPEGCEHGKLALLSGYRWCGGFRNNLSALRTKGLMEGENLGVMKATAAGHAAAQTFVSPMPSGKDLVKFWLERFGKGEREILQVLLDNPEGLDGPGLAAATGREWCGGFRNLLSTLRTAGVLVGASNLATMKASEDLLAANAL